MKKILIPLFILTMTFTGPDIFSQTVSEKEIFTLSYRGFPEVYNFKYDERSGNYCYSYKIPDQGKSFLISRSGESEKYDYFITTDIKFDSRGNYFAVAGDYSSDYGINNNFLIVNGKTLKGLEYIESFSGFMNNKDEYVFAFKMDEKYYFGYVKGDGSFRQSEKYDLIKPIYNYTEYMDMEGDEEYVDEDTFYKNEKGERGFIVIRNGKAGIKFGDNIQMTNYSDINESSLTFNKKNELSFIAKNGGRFYEKYGNEFVVSGKKFYKSFDFVLPPVQFADGNEPVYKAGDSLQDYTQKLFVVKGNKQLPVKFSLADLSSSSDIFSQIYDIKISAKGEISYFAYNEVVKKAGSSDPDSYDQYYTRVYFVKNGKAVPLGYNTGKFIYDSNGSIIYSGIVDLAKMENILMQFYGGSIIIIAQGGYDYIADYGFTKDGKIYYFAQKNDPENSGSEITTDFYFDNKFIGSFEYASFQGLNKDLSMLVFDSSGNYAYSVDSKDGEGQYFSEIFTDKGKVKYPSGMMTGTGKFQNINSMFYTVNGKLFYVGVTDLDTVNYIYTNELITGERSLGKYFNSINDMKYDAVKNELTFIGSRNESFYKVTVDF
ncbi:MAG: hypothetical protein JSS91_05525 [Bacteroidetes bacterium]|nr:hypothetical protein [Bacteroidota bacterium]